MPKPHWIVPGRNPEKTRRKGKMKMPRKPNRISKIADLQRLRRQAMNNVSRNQRLVDQDPRHDPHNLRVWEQAVRDYDRAIDRLRTPAEKQDIRRRNFLRLGGIRAKRWLRRISAVLVLASSLNGCTNAPSTGGGAGGSGGGSNVDNVGSGGVETLWIERVYDSPNGPDLYKIRVRGGRPTYTRPQVTRGAGADRP